jgi:hypothetical protein
MQGSSFRWLFIISVIWGVLIPWVALYPPMIDFPQHAGQVTLLREMLLGQSPWTEQFRFNFFTPYVIGYGLALPLSFIMSSNAALKLLLSLSYIAFVYMCVKLRKQFKADPRLDWFFLISFFGYSYIWGFLTFLIAAPIGLWFILLADRYAEQRTFGRGAAMIAVGTLTLASHGIIFGFAWGVGGALLVVRLRKLKPLLSAIWPYAVLVAICGTYFWINRKINTEIQINLEPGIKWNFELVDRLKAPLYGIGAGLQRTASAPYWPIVFFGAALPWLMGLRIDWRHKSSWVPFVIVVLILMFVPFLAYDSSHLYQRFALFLLPAYAWMFSKKPATDDQPPAKQSFSTRLYLPLLVLACWTMLGVHTVRSWRFAQESADFNAVLRVLEPGQRALSMVFEPSSDAANTHFVYLHYPVWYQAEKSGFVDFNFAWFPPQIVRFRAEHLPAVDKGLDWNPGDFNWKQNHGDDYRYFIVRHTEPIPKNLFDGAECPPVTLIESGTWTVFERRACSSGKFSAAR